jgi:hypothetical protein
MRLITRTAGILPIDPDRDPGAALDLVDKALETKNRLVRFHEGRRSPTGEITDFLLGIALVLERTGAKAVPVHIAGTYEAWPRSRALPRPHKVTIRFGTAISADDLAERGEGESPSGAHCECAGEKGSKAPTPSRVIAVNCALPSSLPQDTRPILPEHPSISVCYIRVGQHSMNRQREGNSTLLLVP